MASPEPISQIDNENRTYAQPVAINLTPNRHPPVEIFDIACKPILQRINLVIKLQLENKFDGGYYSNDDIGPFNDAVELEVE